VDEVSNLDMDDLPRGQSWASRTVIST